MDPDELAASVQGTPGIAPLPRIDGSPRAGSVPHRGRGLRQHKPRTSGRTRRTARISWARVKALPGFGEQKAQDLRCPPGQAVGCPTLMGCEHGVPSPLGSPRAATSRSPTSPTPRRHGQVGCGGRQEGGESRRRRPRHTLLRRLSAALRPLRAPPLSLHRGQARPGPISSRPASRAASTWCSCGTRTWKPDRCSLGPPWSATSVYDAGVPFVLQRPPRSGVGPRGRRGARRPGRCAGGTGPAHSGSRRHHRSVHPRTGGPRRRRSPVEDVTYVSAGPGSRQTPTKPGRAGTGLDSSSQATARSTPVFVTGGVTAERVRHWPRPVFATSSWCVL